MQLIPVGLIGYDVCIKESPELWINGPEYTYRLQSNTTLIQGQPKTESLLNITTTIKCRPFTTPSQELINGLQCRITDAVSHQDSIDYSRKPPSHNVFGGRATLQAKNQIFTILYDKNGVQSLGVDPATSGSDIVMYRIIAQHLNLAETDFEENSDSFTLHKPEKCIFGMCQTQIDVSTKIKFKSEQWGSKCDKIHLETLAYGDRHPLIVINKTRNTAECTDHLPHFFGSDDSSRTYNASKTSSFTEFIVAPLSFGSLTASLSTVKIPNFPGALVSNEFVDLRLISIEPADEPLNQVTISKYKIFNYTKV